MLGTKQMISLEEEFSELDRKLILFLCDNFSNFINSQEFSKYDGTHQISKDALSNAIGYLDLKTISKLLNRLIRMGFISPYLDHNKSINGYRFYSFFKSLEWNSESPNFTISFSSLGMINSFIVYVEKFL